MVNKKKQVKNRKGSIEDEQGKQKAQNKEELVSQHSRQQSKVSQGSSEEEENVQASASRSRSGKLLRREPNSPVDFMMSPECMETFKKAGWLGYLQCLRGYHSEIALAFARSFDGHEATIGIVTLFVSEVSIAELGRLQLGGKRFTKKHKIDEQAANKFLRSEFHNPDWSHGIDTRCLKKEYLPWLNAIKLYITCDGRYNHMFRYQIWFLMHLAGDIKVNLPYFLLHSLTKMSRKVQKFPELAETSLLHHSLITMLLNDALDCYNMTFSEFLIQSNFSCQTSSKKKETEKGESSKAASRETVKEEMKKPAVISEIGPGSKLENPEITVTSARRSDRVQKRKGQTNKDKSVKNDQEKSERSNENPFVRQRQTRPSNKFRLKGKMMIDPKIKNDEVILLDSDQSPSEVHVDESKKRKTKKRGKAKSSSGNKKLKRKLVFKDHELASGKGETLDGLDVISDEVLKEPDHEDMHEFLSPAKKLASSETDERDLKQKIQEWKTVLAEEKGKDEQGKAARIYGKLINIGHLAEELTSMIDTAVKTNVQAGFEDVKHSKEAKGKKVDHI